MVEVSLAISNTQTQRVTRLVDQIRLNRQLDLGNKQRHQSGNSNASISLREVVSSWWLVFILHMMPRLSSGYGFLWTLDELECPASFLVRQRRQVVLVSSAAHPLARKGQASVADIDGQSFVMREPGSQDYQGQVHKGPRRRNRSSGTRCTP